MGVGKKALRNKKNPVLRDVVSRKHCTLIETQTIYFYEQKLLVKKVASKYTKKVQVGRL